MDKKLIVHLRLYKGAQLLYDANGRITNENQIYKVEYGTKMWQIAVTEGNLRNEYGVVKLEKIVDLQGNEVTQVEFESGMPVDLVELVSKEVAAIHNGQEKGMTPEQKQIEEMKAELEKMKSLTSQLLGKSNNSSKQDETISSIEVLRAEYEALLGEKPHHKVSAEKLQAAISEAKNK